MVGEAQDGRQAVQLTRKLRPAVVVMDIAMPLLNGLEATRQILQRLSRHQVLILSAHSDDAYVEQVTEFGAAGFLLKQTSSHDSGHGDSGGPKGKHLFQPLHFQARSERRDRSRSIATGQSKKKGNRLSSREVEVLQLIAEGKANKQIAAELGIELQNGRQTSAASHEKLDIHDTAGLTRYAIARESSRAVSS